MSEEDRDVKLDELVLECGVTLHLIPGRQTVMTEFFGEAGGFDVLKSGGAENVTANPGTLRGFTRMFNYIAGWCVTNDVPQDVRADYEMFGGGEFATRSRWVRQIATEQEIAQLFALALALTFQRK